MKVERQLSFTLITVSLNGFTDIGLIPSSKAQGDMTGLDLNEIHDFAVSLAKGAGKMILAASSARSAKQTLASADVSKKNRVDRKHLYLRCIQCRHSRASFCINFSRD